VDVFSPIKDVIKDIKAGKIIILVDNPERENEGDFFIPADLITPEKVNFMLHNGRGILCVAIDQDKAHSLGLTSMVPLKRNTETTKVNFAVSVNAKNSITSGVSAFDRAKTIKVLADPKSTEDDITKPGHVFPLISHPGGLAKRQGHTEAAVTLAELTGFKPVGVICEILNTDGTMATVPNLISLAKSNNMKIASISDLETYIKSHPIKTVKTSSVIQTASSKLQTIYGECTIKIFRSIYDGLEHSLLIFGEPKAHVLTRLHSQCVTGDTFGSLYCDCGEQLKMSFEKIKQHGNGILLYLNQEGRGIGLSAKINAYAKQQAGLDTVEANIALGFKADERDYTVASDMLKKIGVYDIDLLTNNPLKTSSLKNHGITIHKRIPLESKPTKINRAYLETKKFKMGHQLEKL
jgi:3,4-dihydroxy 2-butanone 4-phosphate synthase/GTP cyclohydrolase II